MLWVSRHPRKGSHCRGHGRDAHERSQGAGSRFYGDALSSVSYESGHLSGSGWSRGEHQASLTDLASAPGTWAGDGASTEGLGALASCDLGRFHFSDAGASSNPSTTFLKELTNECSGSL